MPLTPLFASLADGRVMLDSPGKADSMGGDAGLCWSMMMMMMLLLILVVLAMLAMLVMYDGWDGR